MPIGIQLLIPRVTCLNFLPRERRKQARSGHTRLCFFEGEMHSLDAIYRTLPALLCRLQAVGRVLSGKARWHIVAAAVFLSSVSHGLNSTE